MKQKRPGWQDGGAASPPRPPAKRCRSFDLEFRGCREQQELTTSLQKLEAAISRIPEELSKALTNFFSHTPRSEFDQNQPPMYKLCFLGNLSDVVFTKRDISANNGGPIKIALMVDNQQIGAHHRLSSAKVKIVVLDGDFSEDNQEHWTKEQFDSRIIRPRNNVGAVLTGDLEFRLNNGVADLPRATFLDNSKFTRSGKFRLGVMLVDDIGERVKEGITKPFTVRDRRGEGARKHDIPSLTDEVWRLKRISNGGVYHEALTKSGIFLVKDFLRLYNKDEDSLRKILKAMPQTAWTTTVDHAKKCEPGKDLYSYFIEGKNVGLFFNSMHQLVGATFDGHYTDISNLDRAKKTLVERWSKEAYEDMTDRQPDYEMENGQPKPIDGISLRGSCSPQTNDSVLREGNHDKVHHQVDQQGTSAGNEFFGNHSQQHTFTGSMRVLRVPSADQKHDNASFDINVVLDPNVPPHYPPTTANDVPESTTPGQVIPNTHFTIHGIPVSQEYYCGLEQPPVIQCAVPPLSTSSFTINLSNFTELHEHWERNLLGEETGLDGNSPGCSPSTANNLPPSLRSKAMKLQRELELELALKL